MSRPEEGPRRRPGRVDHLDLLHHGNGRLWSPDGGFFTFAATDVAPGATLRVGDAVTFVVDSRIVRRARFIRHAADPRDDIV